MAKYEMNLDLNVLNHLGINLYTKIPAVLSEAVANAYDADATTVSIDIINDDCVVIKDNGVGMSNSQINDRFLMVGYEKRRELKETPIFKRKPMGRKGIGKLSLFSIANIIEVQTFNGETKDAFVINVKELKEFIANKENSKERKSYLPTPIEPTIIETGTIIKLTEIRKNRTLKNSEKIRTELARRFSVFSENFSVLVNGKAIKLEDRKYFEHVAKIYTYGDCGFDPNKECKNLQYGIEKRSEEISEKYKINGWIGFVSDQECLKVPEENGNLNKIYLFCRGKMGQEDILSSIKNSSNYNHYIVGIINADFFDEDSDIDNVESDMATTSRENFNQESDEYKILKDFLVEEVKHIGNDWNEIKAKEGVSKAINMEPTIEKWYAGLSKDEQKMAQKVLGNINRTITREVDRKEITKYGILAFEKMRHAKNLTAIENMTAESIKELGTVLCGIDDLEASLFYQVVESRLNVLNKFREIASKDTDALESVIQNYLFKHLWLLDPAWERPTSNEEKEKTFKKLFDETVTLTEEEKNARLDICFKDIAGKFVVIELKKYRRKLKSGELHDQLYKYKSALEKCLLNTGRSDNYEIIVILGEPINGDSSAKARKDVLETIKPYNARIVYYDELIENALTAYKAYFDKHEEINEIIQLFKKLDDKQQ